MQQESASTNDHFSEINELNNFTKHSVPLPTIVAKKFLFLFCLIFLSLLLLELLLQGASALYQLLNKNNSNSQSNVLGLTSETKDTVNIIFSGDSWTAGSDAPIGKGYADVLQTKLISEYPQFDFSFHNFARYGNNSAEAIVPILRNWNKTNPDIIILLVGINNGWNTHDNEIAEQELKVVSDVTENKPTSSNIKLSNSLLNLRITKLIKLAHFAFFWRNRQLEYGQPIDSFGDEYFYFYSDKNDPDAALQYLIENVSQARNYDTFYKYILYHFNYDSNKANDYLLSKNLYFPDKLTTSFDQNKHDEQVESYSAILSDHIKQLNELCKKNNTTLILQTYPRKKEDEWAKDINTLVRSIASRENLYFIDNENIFFSNYSEEELAEINTAYHVNEIGYARMAESIFTLLQENNLIR